MTMRLPSRVKATSAAKTRISGKWRITERDLWDQDAIEPPLLGLSCHFEHRETLSYFTLDGVTFTPLSFCEILFSLIVSEPPAPRGTAQSAGPNH